MKKYGLAALLNKIDDAAAPIQPIVEGIVTFPNGVGPIGQPFFDGKGVLQVLRTGAPQGSYAFILDPGLPGNAGAVPAVPEIPLLAPPDPDVRTMITPFGSGSPPMSGIATIGVSYLLSPLPGVGAFSILVVLENLGFIPTDPINGFQIVVWRGLGGGPVL